MRSVSGRTPRKGARPEFPNIVRAGLPPLLAILLAIPCFRFPFLFDDFDFLIRAGAFDLGQLLPDPRLAFYRPVSREVYFGLLHVLGGTNPFWGHALNALLVALATAMLADIVRRLAGARAGFIAGLMFASLSPLPLLVGWISCSQDVMAIAFILTALDLQLRNRTWAALGACVAALLSKETSILVVPVIAALPWILENDRRRTLAHVPRYGVACLAWGLVHPKVQALFHRGLVTGEAGYIGLDNPKALGNSASMVATLLNLPPTGLRTEWPSELTWVLVAGLIAMLLAHRVWPETPVGKKSAGFARGRVVLLGLLLLLPTAVFTGLLVKHWAPYYAGVPAIGAVILCSVTLAGMERRGAAALLMLFLALGIWSRGTDLGLRYRPSEKNWRAISRDLDRAATGLKRLRPTLAESTRVYVSVQAPEDRRIHAHFFRYQAPRVWYANSSVSVRSFEQFDPDVTPFALFWVNKDADVFELRYPSLEVGPADNEPDYADYQKARRSLALGLARAGRVEEAVQAILAMRAVNRVQWAFDRRLAAAICISAGRKEDALKLLGGLPAMDRTEARYALAAALGVQDATESFDLAAFEAFGVPANDLEAWRYLMHWYVSTDQTDAAYRMAVHLRSRSPSDEEAGLVIKAVLERPLWEPVTVAPE